MHSLHQRVELPFTKASACGNDFLMVEGKHTSGDLLALTRRLCDRHRGVGADGVEWLFPDAEADVKARLINADGSEAEISGNGTRCVAAEICSRAGKTEIVVRTGAGLKTCRLISQQGDRQDGRQGSTFEFETDMGQPEVGGELAIETMWVRAVGTKVSMGNPHFVIFVENFQDGWQRQAALVATQPQFPHGTNVEYVVVRPADNSANKRGPNEIEIRLFERGVGETESSGTGSCAAAVAAIASRRVASPVTVIAPGGAQTVRWENQVYLRGPATLVCRGEFFV
ncbi:MAG: diaminopimelate epimerase [Terriglobales bacterium]